MTLNHKISGQHRKSQPVKKLLDKYQVILYNIINKIVKVKMQVRLLSFPQGAVVQLVRIAPSDCVIAWGEVIAAR